MVAIARDYYRARKYDVAKYALQAILDGSEDGSIPARDPGNGEAHLLRGLILRELGDRRGAITDFEKAILRRPDLFEAYINLGEMKLQAGNAQEALGPLEKAVKYAPNSPIAHLDLGECYRLLGRAGDAKKELDTALAQDSSLASIHYNLGLLYLFAPSVPGVSGPDDQIAQSIKELEMFKSMRGANAKKGQGDDIEDLLATAKRKQAELNLKKQAANPPPPPPPPPAAGGDAGVHKDGG
jgi:tetratricopeptide (TPR) repeat protein